MRLISSLVLCGFLFWGAQYVHGAEVQAPPFKYALAQLLTIALERNPSLATAEADVEASQGRLLGAKAYPNPELKAEAGPGRSLEGPANRGTEESFRFSQPLEWIPKRSARIRAGGHDV